MKFNNKNVSELKSQPKNRIAASIGNPLKMLKMFTKDLYKFPVQTSIQEYINNAKDAHLMVGKDTSSIEITGPTVASQTVVVKDYGPGISPEDMINIFASITTSNKDNSNLFNGGFGIGSKSWFAINSIFSVISTCNGTKRFYSILFSDNIYVDLDMEVPTDEPNGVEVHLPLPDVSMIGAAQTAIERATKHWKNKPVYKNCNFDPNLDIHHQEKDFTIYTKEGQEDRLEVTLGETIYSVKDFPKYSKWASKLESPTAIHFEVGEVKLSQGQEVGPDRENFVQEMEPHIDKKIKALEAKLPPILNEYIKRLTSPAHVLNLLKYSKYLDKYKNHQMDYKGFSLTVCGTSPNYTLRDFKKIIRRPNTGLDDLSFFTVNLDGDSHWHDTYLFVVKDDKDIKAKEMQKLVKFELNKRDKNYAGVVESLSLLQEKTLKKIGIEFCLLSEIEYEEELEVFDLEKQIYVKKLGSPEPNPDDRRPHYYRNQSRDLRRKKVRIKDLDKDIPIVGHTNSKKISECKILLSELGLEAYETPNKNVAQLLSVGFKEFNIEIFFRKAKVFNDNKNKKRDLEARKRKKQALERKRRIEEAAKSPEITSIMALASLSDFIKVHMNISLYSWLSQAKTLETNNSLINSLQALDLPKNFLNIIKEYREVKDFDQNKELLPGLKNLMRNYPLTFDALTKVSTIKNPKRKKELEILLDNIDTKK